MPVTSEHIAHLSGDVLLALARNEAAQMRKAAVEIMLEKGYKQVNHPEIAGMVAEVRKEREARMEVESIVESAIESELPEGTGPLVASVTTATMQQPTIVHNGPSDYPFLGTVVDGNFVQKTDAGDAFESLINASLPVDMPTDEDLKSNSVRVNFPEPVEETGTQKLNDWIRRVEAGNPIVVTHPSEEQQKSDFIEQHFPLNPLETTQADELPQASD